LGSKKKLKDRIRGLGAPAKKTKRDLVASNIKPGPYVLQNLGEPKNQVDWGVGIDDRGNKVAQKKDSRIEKRRREHSKEPRRVK